MRHTKRRKGSSDCHDLLEKYEKLLKAIAKASNQLMVQEDINKAIPRALQVFGKEVEARQLAVFKICEDRETKEPFIQLYCEWWAREDSLEKITNWEKQIRNGMKQLADGESVRIEKESFPELVRERYKQQKKALSIQLVPIRIGKEFWGCFGISHKQKINDSEGHEEALLAMASTIGASIKRHEEWEKQKDSETKILDIIDNVPGVIYQWVECKDGTFRINYISSKLKDLLGISPAAAETDPYAIVDLIHPDDRKHWRQSILLSKVMMSPWNFEGRLVMPTGDIKWWQGIARPSRGKNGDIFFNGMIIDVTERKHFIESLERANEELERKNKTLQEMSMIDSLTGVPNRRKYEEYIKTQWNQAYRDGSSIAVIFIDIDNFKAYNDRYGHLEGDKCLRMVAEVLNSCLRRSSDFLSRLGGEEFVAVLPGTATKGARMVAENMRSRVEGENITHPDSPTSHWVTVSAGVAGTRPKYDEFTMNELLELADKSLYVAKRSGKNSVK